MYTRKRIKGDKEITEEVEEWEDVFWHHIRAIFICPVIAVIAIFAIFWLVLTLPFAVIRAIYYPKVTPIFDFPLYAKTRYQGKK